MRCESKNLKSTAIETIVWGDIERFLRAPGEVIDELSRESGDAQLQAVRAAERITFEAAIADLETRGSTPSTCARRASFRTLNSWSGSHA